jgi:hypothetical protein
LESYLHQSVEKSTFLLMRSNCTKGRIWTFKDKSGKQTLTYKCIYVIFLNYYHFCDVYVCYFVQLKGFQSICSMGGIFNIQLVDYERTYHDSP